MQWIIFNISNGVKAVKQGGVLSQVVFVYNRWITERIQCCRCTVLLTVI